MPKTNWQRIEAQRPEDTLKNRDVYEDQQLERSKIQEKISPTSRIVFSVIVGVIVAIAMYLFISIGGYVKNEISNIRQGTAPAPEYDVIPEGVIVKDRYNDPNIGLTSRYYIDDNLDGVPDGEYFDSREKAEKAYIKEHQDVLPLYTEDEHDEIRSEYAYKNSFAYYARPTFLKIFLSLISGLMAYAILYQVMMRNLKAQNMLADTSDINQYQNDQHIALPEEVMQKFDWFPDVGAHSAVTFSSMISHAAIKNKGLKSIKLSERYKEDVKDADGDILHYKGEIIFDEDGNPVQKEVPLIDEKFMDDLFEASGLPTGKNALGEPFRKYYDTTKIPYNPDGRDRDKLGKFDTVADLINKDWELPYYEPQRPGGAYLVDTAPVNTMVLAITRAGKGQTVIE